MSESASCGKAVLFNYLVYLAATSITVIQPQRLYLNDILVAKKSAKLLLYGKEKSAKPHISELNEKMTLLANHLDIPFSIQVLQTALLRYGKEKLTSKPQNFRKYYNR